MVVPAILAGAGLGIGALYSYGKARDNRRYWDEYARRTHVSVRYPYRSGVNDWMGYAAKTMMAPAMIGKYGRSAYRSYSRYRWY